MLFFAVQDPPHSLTTFAIIMVALAALALLYDLYSTARRRARRSTYHRTDSAPPALSHLIIFSSLTYSGFFDIGNYWTWWSLALITNLAFLGMLGLLQLKEWIEKTDRENSGTNEFSQSFFLLATLLIVNTLAYLFVIVVPRSIAEITLLRKLESLLATVGDAWPYILYGLAILQFLLYRKNPKAFASVVVLLITITTAPLFLTTYWIPLLVGSVLFILLSAIRDRQLSVVPGEGETTSVFLLFCFFIMLSVGLSFL